MVRHGVVLAQAFANLNGANIKVDGVVGPRTREAVGQLPAQSISRLSGALKEKGISLESLLAGPKATSGASKPQQEWINTIAYAKEFLPKVGLRWDFAVAQWTHESGHGRSVPTVGGRSSYNFGGIKANSARQYSGVATSTYEYVNGRKIRTSAEWAVFDDEKHFVQSYAYYLLEGPSSYRYRKGYKGTKGRVQRMNITDARSIGEFAEVLFIGGYATDPEYVDRLVGVHRSTHRRYGYV